MKVHQTYDLLVLGGGSGGVAAARRAGALGARVGLCEERQVGGTCVHRGCIPKKLLVHASQFPGLLEMAGGYGWEVPPARLDFRRLQQAIRAELFSRNDQRRPRLQTVLQPGVPHPGLVRLAPAPPFSRL